VNNQASGPGTPGGGTPGPPHDAPVQPDEGLLRQVMSDVEDLVARHGWRTTPRRRMAYLLGETVELAEEVLQLPASGPGDDALLHKIGSEIYDVLWNACDLARLTGIDLARAAAGKRRVNQNRTWPAPE
jgi:NTP pyrophosphatase (non-canonical NTP hydrolase)